MYLAESFYGCQHQLAGTNTVGCNRQYVHLLRLLHVILDLQWVGREGASHYPGTSYKYNIVQLLSSSWSTVHWKHAYD